MSNITISELIKARDKCAAVIAKYGDCYLPIFERLENEIIERQKRKNYYKRRYHCISKMLHKMTHIMLHKINKAKYI